MQSNNKQLIEISRLAQALFHSRVLSHKKELKNTERIKAREWKRILTGKERIESLGGNWSGFKIKLREVRDGGREGKRELRSAFNDDFFLSCSFHILSFFFFFLKVKRKEGKDLRFLRPPSDRSSPSLPLPRSLCPSPPRLPQSILDHQCQLWATVKLHPSPAVTSPPPTPPPLSFCLEQFTPSTSANWQSEEQITGQ